MRLDTIVIDCHDKHALAAFWCAVLGTTVRGEAAQYLGLHPTAEGHPRLVFQQVDVPRTAGGRLHLDLETHDLEADTATVLALGGSLERKVEQFGTAWHVMRDPEGNVFCLVPSE